MIRPLRTASLAACAGLAAGLLGSAQTATEAPQNPAPQQRPPTFRGGAVLVTVDAYPQRDGRIVEGLKPTDFEVFEDGVRQAVENFEFVRVEPGLSESSRRDPETQAESVRLAADPHNRVFVVFLDALHVDVEGSHNIRRPLVDTLNRIVAPDDLFGVMTQNIDPRHLVLARRLLAVEEQLTTHWPWGEQWRLGWDETDPMEKDIRSCFQYPPWPTNQEWLFNDDGYERPLFKVLIDRRREDRTLNSLESLLDYLTGLREARTVLLLVSNGWRLFRHDSALADTVAKLGPAQPGVYIGPGGKLGSGRSNAGSVLEPSVCTGEGARLAMLDNGPRFRALMERANRANVSFYPVTPSGLAAFDVPISEKYRPSLALDQARINNRLDVLRTLAQNTDGLAIVNTNDLSGGMRRIVDDVSAYYLLGYYSTNTKNDGKFRRIEVKVQQPGMQTRARRGYFSPAPAPVEPRAGSAPARPPAVASPAADVDAALATLARLRTTTALFTRAVVVGETVNVAVELASSQLMSAPWNGGAEVQVNVTGRGAGALPTVSVQIPAGSRGALARVQLGGLQAPIRVATRVRAGAEVLDDIVEVRGDAAPAEPMLFRGRPAGTAPLQPAADPEFRRTERLHAEWPAGADTDGRIARILGRNGQPLPVPATVTERDVDGTRVLAVDVNLAPLSAGDYILELTSERAPGAARRLVAFRIIQ